MGSTRKIPRAANPTLQDPRLFRLISDKSDPDRAYVSLIRSLLSYRGSGGRQNSSFRATFRAPACGEPGTQDSRHTCRQFADDPNSAARGALGGSSPARSDGERAIW